MNLANRIKRRLQMIKKDFKNDSKFANKFACFRLIDELSWRLGLTKTANVFHKKKDLWINEYLCKCFAQIIEEYKEKNDEGIYEDKVSEGLSFLILSLS